MTTALTHDETVALCKVVGVLLVTDGFLTDAEFDYFVELLARHGLDESAGEAIRAAIQIDADVTPWVRTLAQGGHGETLLEELRRAMTIDGNTAPAEQDVFDRVRHLLS